MPHLFGTIQRTDADSTIEMRHTMTASPADTWDALTSPERTARWLGQLSGDLRQGGQYHLAFDQSDPSQIVDGQVLRCVPVDVLEVTWQAPGEQRSFVTVTLTPTDEGTELVLIHSALRQPSSDTGHAAGWQVHLDQLAEGLAHDDWSERWEAWEGLERAYTATLKKPDRQQ